MNDLVWLIANCVSVHCDFNGHRDYYQTAADAFEEDDRKPERDRRLDHVSADMRKRCIELDSILELHIYPDTPVGFTLYWHHDLEALCKQARGDIEKRRVKE